MSVDHRFADVKVLVGLTISATSVSAAVPTLYSDAWRWVDNHAAYYHKLNIPTSIHVVSSSCAAYTRTSGYLTNVKCDEEMSAVYVCETFKNSTKVTWQAVTFPTVSHNVSLAKPGSGGLVACSTGQLTKDFISCDDQGPCVADSLITCPVEGTSVEVPMFPCSRGISLIHYSLVCDHRGHCLDYSDEDSCIHNTQCLLTDFQCRDGQCIDKSRACDGTPDCQDESDENCRNDIKPMSPTASLPLKIIMDGRGNHDAIAMGANEPCPDTHFRCTSEEYCLPVYLRCNGFDDCPGREDEDGCASFTCPGFYRCRKSSVCLHPDHVCDGAVQCPQHDDEELCTMPGCPEGCVCQGLAFVCTQAFEVATYSDLRFVDARGRGMMPEQFANLVYLIRLHLHECSIKQLVALSLKNLNYLDLSNNLITTLNMDVFKDLTNLRFLYLDSNPLKTLIAPTQAFTSPLDTLSMAFTKLEVLDGAALRNFQNLVTLNVSHSTLTTIPAAGLRTTKLRYLDLSHCPLVSFPSDLFLKLPNLEKVWVRWHFFVSLDKVWVR
jgi:hypothetical protein